MVDKPLAINLPMVNNPAAVVDTLGTTPASVRGLRGSLRGAWSRLGNRLWGLPPLPSITPFSEQGSSGTAIFGGYPQIKDQSPKWVGLQRYRTASELAVNVSVVAAGIHYFLNLIANPKWKAQPSDPNNPEAVRLAEFVDSVLVDLTQPWASVVRQAGVYRFHGFSIQEWTAKQRDDGMIGIESVEVRPQHTIEQWAVDDFGTVLGMFQRNPQTSQLLGIPRKKVMYIVEDTLTDSPEGLGVFRHLAEPYGRLKRLLELEVRAYERDLRGIPIGRAPLAAINQAVAAGAMTADAAASLIQGMKDMIQIQVKQSDTGLLLDSATYINTTSGGPTVSTEKQWGMDLLSGPGLGLAEIAAAIDRLQREMARIIGVEHLMLGDNGGSRAVAQDKSRNVYLIASSVLRMIVASAQNDIIKPLWQLNGLDKKLMPRLMAEDIAPRDVVEVGTTLARMAQAGAVLAPDDPIVNDVRDMLGVSRAKPIFPDRMLSDVNPSNLLDLPLNLPLAQDGGGDVSIPPEDGNQPQLPPNASGNKPTVGNVDAQGKPRQSAEMQRLPRNTIANTDPAKIARANGRA